MLVSLARVWKINDLFLIDNIWTINSHYNPVENKNGSVVFLFEIYVKYCMRKKSYLHLQLHIQNSFRKKFDYKEEGRE